MQASTICSAGGTSFTGPMVTRPTTHGVCQGVGFRPRDEEKATLSVENIIGVLPWRTLNTDLWKLPGFFTFVDSGGFLPSCREAEEILLSEAVQVGLKTGASRIELRHERPLTSCNDISTYCDERSRKPLQVATRSDKVRMLLGLPESSELLMEFFKSKLRSQINRSLKEGFTSSTGGLELLEDFYEVFLVNMRDLGSPVHSVDLMRHVLSEFSEAL